MVERYYGHLAPKNKSEAMARLPRFPGQFPSEIVAEGSHAPCAARVPKQVATPGAYGAHGAISVPTTETQKAAVLVEKRPLARRESSEGRRTRTFNQRIKSPMLYH